MNKLSLITLLFASLLSSMTYAAKSSDIPLGEFKVEPGQTLILPFEKLYDGITYDLSCKFDIKGSLETYSHMQIFCPLNTSFRKSGTDFDEKCQNKGNVIFYKTDGDGSTIYKITKADSVSIRNLDYTDSITIKCTGRI